MISKIISWSFWRSTIWSIRQSCKTLETNSWVPIHRSMCFSDFGSVQLIQCWSSWIWKVQCSCDRHFHAFHSVSGGGKRFNRAPLSTESQMLTSPQQRNHKRSVARASKPHWTSETTLSLSLYNNHHNCHYITLSLSLYNITFLKKMKLVKVSKRNHYHCH